MSKVFRIPYAIPDAGLQPLLQLQERLVGEAVKQATMLPPATISINPSLTKPISYRSTQAEIELLNERLKPIQQEIAERMNKQIEHELLAQSRATERDAAIERIYASHMGRTSNEPYNTFVGLRAKTANGSWWYDVRRSRISQREELFSWLDRNTVGVWRTGPVSIEFTHEEDASLFLIKFSG